MESSLTDRNCLAILSLAALLLTTGCHTGERIEPAVARFDTSARSSIVWDFELDQPGRLPSGWTIAETNPTKSLATWKVVEDRTAPAGSRVMGLTQTENYNGTYNLAIADQTWFQDLDLTARVKAVSGEEDQGGGPIWRCQDPDNYYICRFNPLESNYRVYVVFNGKRRQLASTKLELEAERWYTIRVTMTGRHINCYLDGEKLLDVSDDTIVASGMIGLWTKADAVTSFDDLTVRAFRTEILRA